MVGFTAALTGIASPEAARKAIRDSVPPGTESLNFAAFEKGLNFGLNRIRGSLDDHKQSVSNVGSIRQLNDNFGYAVPEVANVCQPINSKGQ